MADARALGLREEYQNGVYTCCHLAAWAHEQWLAWFDATNGDANHDVERTINPNYEEGEAALVHVRFRRPVPWFTRFEP
jgi:hypothetical protein